MAEKPSFTSENRAIVTQDWIVFSINSILCDLSEAFYSSFLRYAMKVCWEYTYRFIEKENGALGHDGRCEEFTGLPFEAGGYNIGINVGTPAGQTVMHCHIHLIPRRSGDSVNPRGGVRGVIAGKADYSRND